MSSRCASETIGRLQEFYHVVSKDFQGSPQPGWLRDSPRDFHINKEFDAIDIYCVFAFLRLKRKNAI